ncbi:MAG: molybdenum ABC transporter ATP-binding protein [Deltaproteobacteria bacterium]|nr:MAG: molybdenum ABC transporter ATP-binding protein [Deltaproteobacteria bacterium]
MIKVSHVNVTLPGFALRDINLTIAPGDFFALIGPTGAGKSLILETILGMLPVDQGTITLGGQDITSLPPEKRGLSIVYQDFALFPHLSVRANILYGTSFHGLSQDQVNPRLTWLVQQLNLAHLLHRQPATLSGGEKQRVALARALIFEPAALLLDEPLSALDPLLREEIKDLLRSIHQKLKTTIIMVSHNFSDVFYLANKVAILKDGHIVQQGSVDEVFHQPNTRFTAGFVGMCNILDVTIQGTQAITRGPIITLPPGCDHHAQLLAIRPEDILPLEPGHKGFDNVLTGTITRIAHQGFYFNVWLDVAGITLQAVWNKHVVLDQHIMKGQTLEVGFHAHKIHVMPG